MTKQEEIREGILKIIHFYNRGTTDANDAQLRDKLISYLHSQGVVIKVDRELPENPIWATLEKTVISGAGIETREQIKLEGAGSTYKIAQQEMLQAGYVAVEPLIKEV